jgi:guanylate kinase
MDNLHSGRDVILEIDVNGGEQVKKAFPAALTIFVLPPSEDELLARLRRRAREDEAKIQRRFSEAKREIAQAKADHAYDHFIVNAQLEEAVEQAYQLVQKYRARV